jgi:trimeric autotransporter adhesin
MRAGIITGLILGVSIQAGLCGDEQWDGRFFYPAAPLEVMVPSPQGGVLCGGKFGSVAGVTGTASLARWDGKTWHSVSAEAITTANGYNPGTVYAITVNGADIYVGGSFQLIGGQGFANVAHWDGKAWHDLGGGVNGGTVRALAFRAGVLYVGGTFTQAGAIPVKHVAAWDGNSWSDLGGGVGTTSYSEVYPPVRTFLAAADGMYVGGQFQSAGGVAATNLAKWSGNGWEPVGGGVTNRVLTLGFDRHNALLVGMFCGGAYSSGAALLAKWDGSSWSAFGQGLTRPSVGQVSTIYVDGDSIYAGGNFVSTGPEPSANFARWDGENWRPTGAPLLGAALVSGDGTNVYAFGTLTSVVANKNAGLVEFDGQKWVTVGAGMGDYASGWLHAIIGLGDQVLIGGIFSGACTAAWDGERWLPFNGVLGVGPSGHIYAFAPSGAGVYAAGDVSTADGAPSQGIAEYTGTRWLAMDGMGHFGRAVASRGSEIFVGHQTGVSRWDGVSWTEVGQDLNGAVATLALVGPDLYAGGAFTNATDSSLQNISRWDGEKWQAVGAGLDAPVKALAASQGCLYAGGAFTNSGSLPLNCIAKWDGKAWAGLGSGVRGGINSMRQPDESFTAVNALAFGPDGVLYAGGNFQLAGEQPAQFIGGWDGANWSALGSGLNYYPTALAVHKDSLYVGGLFSKAGQKESWRFARWQIAPRSAGLCLVAGAEGNTLTLQAVGKPGTVVELQSSPDLVNWSPLSTNTFSAETMSFTESVLPGVTRRFYRLITLP